MIERRNNRQPKSHGMTGFACVHRHQGVCGTFVGAIVAAGGHTVALQYSIVVEGCQQRQPTGIRMTQIARVGGHWMGGRFARGCA